MSLLVSCVSENIETYSKSDDMKLRPHIEVSTNNISTAGDNLYEYDDGISMQAVESDIFKNFVEDIVNHSESMPADIAAFVNENFWDLI